MKNISITSALFASLISVFSSYANAYQTIGTVISTEQAPMMCTERRDNLTSSPFAMAISGGFAGNQFGKGNGKIAMTAVGAAVGAAVGSANRRYNEQRIDCKFDGYISTIEYTDRYGNKFHTTRQSQYALRVGTKLNINVR